MTNTITITINGNTITGTPDAIAQIAGLIGTAPAQARTQAHTSAHTPTQAHTVAPVQARTYEHVRKGFDNFVINVDKKVVEICTAEAYTGMAQSTGKPYTVQAGTPMRNAYGHKDAWAAMKARMRKAGATYDADAKVWAFPSAKAAQAWATGEGSLAISVEEINAIRDKWTDKSAKKAAKAE